MGEYNATTVEIDTKNRIVIPKEFRSFIGEAYGYLWKGKFYVVIEGIEFVRKILKERNRNESSRAHRACTSAFDLLTFDAGGRLVLSGKVMQTTGILRQAVLVRADDKLVLMSPETFREIEEGGDGAVEGIF